MATASNLMALQAPGGVLTSSRLRRVTDPISMTPSTELRMRHFFDGVYDLSPQSHLVRFVKAMLGDSGLGYLTKVYGHAHTQSVLATMRYADLDAFYGDVLGLKRMSWEHTDPALYYRANTPSEWDEIEARDASYRARIEAFSRAIGLGSTPSGLMGVASALLGAEVKMYESYLALDESLAPSVDPHPLRPRTYAEVEEVFGDYRTLNGMTYGDIEGQYGTIGRANVNDRAHFTIRPMRPISGEEAFQLQRVLDRFRPVGTLMSVDPLGLSIHTPITMRGVASDSVHWEVLTLVNPGSGGPIWGTDPVRPDPTGFTTYDQAASNVAFEVPRPAQVNRQSEAWSYNGDVVNVKSYREISEHSWPALEDPDDHAQRLVRPPGQAPWSGVPGMSVNYQRINYSTGPRDYHPAKALADHVAILRGRTVSDSVATSSPVITHSDLSAQVARPDVYRDFTVSRYEVGGPVIV